MASGDTSHARCRPPRGRPGDPEAEVPFDFVFLDPVNRAFPILFPKAA